VVGLMW